MKMLVLTLSILLLWSHAQAYITAKLQTVTNSTNCATNITMVATSSENSSVSLYTTEYKDFGNLYPGQFPFLVLLEVFGFNDEYYWPILVHWCFGVILNKEWLLFATHCIYNETSGMYYNHDMILMYLGKVELQYEYNRSDISCDSYYNQTYKKKISGKEINYFSLLQVTQPLSFCDLVRPAKLASEVWANTVQKTDCVLFGIIGSQKIWDEDQSIQYQKVSVLNGGEYCVCEKENATDAICLNVTETCFSKGTPLICGGKVYGIGHQQYDSSCTKVNTQCKGNMVAYTSFIYLTTYLYWISEFRSIVEEENIFEERALACEKLPKYIIFIHLISLVLVYKVR